MHDCQLTKCTFAGCSTVGNGVYGDVEVCTITIGDFYRQWCPSTICLAGVNLLTDVVDNTECVSIDWIAWCDIWGLRKQLVKHQSWLRARDMVILLRQSSPSIPLWFHCFHPNKHLLWWSWRDLCETTTQDRMQIIASMQHANDKMTFCIII